MAAPDHSKGPCHGFAASSVLPYNGKVADPGRPRVLVWLVVATAIAACLSVPVGLHLWGPYNELDGVYDGQWLGLSVLGAVCLRFASRRDPRTPAWLLGFWTLGLGFLSAAWQRNSYQYGDFSPPVETHLLNEPLEAHWDAVRAGLLFIVFVLPWLVVARVTFDQRFRAWFGSAPAETSGLPNARAGSMAPVLVALVLASVWNRLDALSPWGWGDAYFLGPDTLLYWLNQALWACPFAIQTMLILWLQHERLVVHGAGVRLSVFRRRYSPFSVPWERVRWVDLIVHNAERRSVVIHYRSRFGVPIAFGVPAKRYFDGERAVDELLGHAHELGIEVRRWRSPNRTLNLGWALIALGMVVMLGQKMTSEGLMRGFGTPESLAAMDQVAGLFPLTALHIVPLLLLGLGFGLLSAHQRAGTQMGLLILLMIATTTVFPSPMIHWLYWCALYAIVSARLEPLILLAPVPAPLPGQWDLAYNLVLISPAFIAVGYGLGVTWGRKRTHSRGMESVREPRRVPLSPLVAGSARTLEDV